jgi:dinuclear metal center YbgI/SA1388 family protein
MPHIKENSVTWNHKETVKMKLKELTAFLESLAPLSYQEPYDNSGLLIGAPETEIRAALVCLDVTPEIVQEAIRNNCNLIISHHPFIFRGLKKIEAGKPESDILLEVIKNDIAVYAVHTNLDNSIAGINGFLGRKLGLINTKILSEKNGMLCKLVTFVPMAQSLEVRQALFDAGAGVIGRYDCCSYNIQGHGTFRAASDANPFVGQKNILHTEEETRIEVIFPDFRRDGLISALLKVHPYEEVAYDIYPLGNVFPGCGAGMLGELQETVSGKDFLESVKKILKINIIRHTEPGSKPVKKVALCSGSGSFLIPDAIRANADVFLTADIKYHDFFDANRRILLADIGHYESEQWIKDLLTERLIEKFPNFAVLSSGLNTNPVNYL